MGKLFNRLVDEGLYKDWASLLDWLFDDNRFQNWSSGYVGALTKKIKQLPQIGNDTYFYDCAKKLVFPIERTAHNVLIMMTKGDGEAKDLIRHIRNGIAHGKTDVFKQNNELYIEIVDYSKSGNQSAYLCMPIGYINKIHKLYQDVKKSKGKKK